ncbi:MAG: hypothetical protein J6A76_05640, partial [Oscillospiraceae bacterium]|nr:hypothetical protein [Oscillospiraceae bacterium]
MTNIEISGGKAFTPLSRQAIPFRESPVSLFSALSANIHKIQVYARLEKRYNIDWLVTTFDKQLDRQKFAEQIKKSDFDAAKTAKRIET